LKNFLHQHSKIREVFYPGLQDNQFHELATKQMLNGFGYEYEMEEMRIKTA